MDRDTSSVQGGYSRWLTPGQEMPESSAARFTRSASVQSYGKAASPAENEGVVGAQAEAAPFPKNQQVPPARDEVGKPDRACEHKDIAPILKAKGKEHRPAEVGTTSASGRAILKAPTAVSEEKLSGKKQSEKKTSRKQFARTHAPRIHRTGPQPRLAPYQADIRKLLKKGYTAADIYHWLHDMRAEDVSQRSVQRFVRTLRQISREP